MNGTSILSRRKDFQSSSEFKMAVYFNLIAINNNPFQSSSEFKISRPVRDKDGNIMNFQSSSEFKPAQIKSALSPKTLSILF